MADGLISVVVPFYNNEDVLGECLSSIAAQSHADLEVVMVDDGSTDASADIASAQAAADPRFTLVSIANSGPGAARNAGVAVATGSYLAFVDADDMLPPGAYATMLAVLRQTGSDFVTGGVRRLGADGLRKSGLHARAIKARKLGTHISRSPELLYDVSVWNKLYRRSFWDASDLRLPEGMLWEDLVAMARAHVLARAVDVITDPVYHWRDRDSAAPSITQSRMSIGNFRDRITAFGMIEDFLREHRQRARGLLERHQHKALFNDTWLYVRDLSGASPRYQEEFASLTAGYLRQVSRKVIASLPATHKLAYYLIEHGHQAELVSYAAWLAAMPGRTPPMVRVRGRLLADLPLRTVPARTGRQLAIPARVFRPHRRDFDPYVGVDEICWRDGRLVIDGWAYVPSAGIARRRDTGKLLLLVHRGKRRPPIVLPARSVRRPDVTAASGQDRYSYDWAGFRCQIGPLAFLPGRSRLTRRLLTGDWDCVLLVRGGALWRPARLHSPGPRAEHLSAGQAAPGLRVMPQWAGGRLQLRIRSGQDAPAPASAVRQAWGPGGAMILRGTLPPADQPGLPGEPGWQVVLRNTGGWDRRTLSLPAPGLPAPGLPAPAAAGDASGAFAVTVPVSAMELFGDRRPLPDGRWEITLDDTAGRSAALPFTADARPVRAGRKTYRVAAAGDRLVLTVGPALAPADRGRIRRRLVRDLYYRAQRLLPVREQILLCSFHGKQCGDNPRAIADELRRSAGKYGGDRRAQAWAVSDWSVPVPDGASAVLIGTRAYYAALARSSHLIVNDHLPLPYRKRPGQLHVQTWHGTPLKRLGYDISVPKMASGRRYLDYMASDVAQWDLLLSPNPFATPILRRAFGFGGEICETGYPRDDALSAAAPASAGQPSAAQPSAAQPSAGQIRARLGIPDGRRVALYVPTWRDDQHDASGRYLLDFQLDLDAAAERLGSGYVLLIRGHHLMAGDDPAAGHEGFALDVTAYPGINDLLLVADVLITDYSSVMFDFAPAGRPMLFFTYDLQRYRDQVRGFYFDFEADAPGPLLSTSDEVVAALADLDRVSAAYAGARTAFTARFCPLDDGKASARACDRIFGG